MLQLAKQEQLKITHQRLLEKEWYELPEKYKKAVRIADKHFGFSSATVEVYMDYIFFSLFLPPSPQTLISNFMSKDEGLCLKLKAKSCIFL